MYVQVSTNERTNERTNEWFPNERHSVYVIVHGPRLSPHVSIYFSNEKLPDPFV